MKKHTLFFITCTLINFSCKKENKTDAVIPTDAATLQTVTVKNLPANPDEVVNTQSGHYTFFSFKNNAIVPLSDSASTKWDIGFNSTTIIANSGTSGPGAAAAQVYTGLFDDLSIAPTTGYKTDNKTASPPNAIPSGSGNGWYNYNSDTHVISAIPGRVLLFQTADKKYAKVEIISYYKDMPANPSSSDAGRYYTFRYSYQDDGTTKLK